MSYSRPYGQPQAASPWSAGVPPGLQQQQQAAAQPQQPMFNQPMGAFDISSAWQGQQPTQQWVQQPMPQVQFVANAAFMQQPPQQIRQPLFNQLHHQQQQRPMHQRSLSAPRNGVNGLKRPINQNQGNFGGPQQQNWHGNMNNNRPQQQQQQRFTRQQSRVGNQKVQFNNNHNSNNSINNNNSNNKPQQKQQQQQQQPNKQQQPQQQQQPQPQQAVRKVKVTKVNKKIAIANRVKPASKQLNAKPEGQVEKSEKSPDNSGSNTNPADSSASNEQKPKVQSKTAERKQLKLQARRNAEALEHSKLPVAKASKGASGSDQSQSVDQPIDQAQLKCVPAVFGFVCKLCDVFMRDKVARREHIDSADHMEKFKAFEEAEKAKNDDNNSNNVTATVKQEKEEVVNQEETSKTAEVAAANDDENETVTTDDSKKDTDADATTTTTPTTTTSTTNE